jgi:hypothetical protein
LKFALHLSISISLDILKHLYGEGMPIGNAVAVAVADQATIEGIWDDPDNRVF